MERRPEQAQPLGIPAPLTGRGNVVLSFLDTVKPSRS
jgi:hypothetical protein